MMRPSYRALNRPLTVLSACPTLLGGSLLGASAVFDQTNNFFAGALIGGLLYLASLWATALDPRIDRVLVKALPVKRFYDPLSVDPRRMSDGQ